MFNANELMNYNTGDNILELYSVLVQVRIATNKRNLISSITNLVYELPHESPNDLKLTILGNQEILEKISN